MPQTVLLIDDSKTVQRAASMILAKDAELKLEVSDNAHDALTRLRDLLPSLVIVDHTLPEKDGYEMAAELKKDPDFVSVPIMLLVGPNIRLDTQKAMVLGIAGSLAKPFTSEDFVSSIRSALRGNKPTFVEPTASPLLPPPLPVMPKAPALSLEPPPLAHGSATPVNQMSREAIEKVTRQIIEEVVWEVVPELAESIVREEINRLLR